MRVEQLTFSRFIAALLIVFFHFGKSTWFFNSEHTSVIFQHLNVVVSYFFVLSGFVMVIAYREKVNFFHYIKKRLSRIYPIYLIALLIVSLYMFNIYDFLLNVFMVQSWIKPISLNFPGWSLSVEIFFYALFPILLNKLYLKYELKYLILGVLLFFVVSQISNHYLGDKVLYNPLLHLNSFVAGNIAGLYFLSFKRKYDYSLPILLICFIIILLLKYPIGLNYHNGLLAILFVPLIIMLANSNGFISKSFKWAPLIFLGEISYGIYILQFPVWLIFTDKMMEEIGVFNTSLSFYLKLSILLIISTISHIMVEKPLRIKLNNFNNCKPIQ